jgi:hypothetical protein
MEIVRHKSASESVTEADLAQRPHPRDAAPAVSQLYGSSVEDHPAV